MIKRLNRSRKE